MVRIEELEQRLQQYAQPYIIMLKEWSLILLFCKTCCCVAQPATHAALLPDSAVQAASLKYKNPSFFKRLLLGTNYRTEWATPVRLPVFQLRQMGFTIKELGGGQQTKSLRLLDKSGHEWALRTVDKDVEAALPPQLRNTLAQRVTQDMVSAAHPYAPLVVAQLANATGVVQAEPVFYVVPDDTALGPYNGLFKNTICLLEDRNPTPDRSDTKNTTELIQTLFQNQYAHINGEAVLKARLLDMLVGDWDRHEKQWVWGFEKVGAITDYYAIPKDRDQALFYSRGLLVKLARMIALKHLVGFAKNTAKLKKLNAKEWNFDRVFLAEIPAADWHRVIQQFTAALPDSVIYKAVHTLPPEVYGLHGAVIAKKLIARRNNLPKDALRYYRFIASDIVVAGTDARDRFVMNTTKDSVHIQRYTGPDFSQLVYSRTFHRSQTYQVTLLGLGGDDEFVEIHSTTAKPARIRLAIVGGKGSNQYRLTQNRRIRFFDSGMDSKIYLAIVKKQLRIKDE